jgi:Ca-activated chloride channel family protein
MSAREPARRVTVVGDVSPVLIVVLVLVGLVVVVYLFGLSPEPVRGRRDPGILRRRSKWRRWLPVIPLLGSVGCLALAFSGFRFSFQETSPTTVLVMDVSDSMNATDVAPDRLTAARAAATAFLDELPPDFLVGLATFAGEADLPVPPTRERDALVAALAALSTSNGTRIGDGLTVALDAIEEDRSGTEAPAAVVLLSDGRDTGSVIPPLVAAERARDMSVPVLTVAFGGQVTEEGGADLETLQRIAATSGGETFTAETADELTRRFTTIGSQLLVDLDVQPSATPLVIAAIALVVVAGFMLVLTPR